MPSVRITASVACQYWLAGLVLAVAAPAMAACTHWAVSPSLGSESSRWTEYNQSEQTLVQEDGHLSSVGLGVSWQCHSVSYSLLYQDARGRRSYRGLANNGQWLTSSSQIWHRNLGVEVSLPVNGNWALGVRLRNHRLHRDIQSISVASGYLEKIDFWTVQVGAAVRYPLSSHWAWTAGAWVGATPDGHMKVDLPNADPVKLPLGSGRSTALDLGLTYASQPDQLASWEWSVHWLLEQQVFAQGDSKPLFRGNRRVGAAWQPETHQTSHQLKLQAQYRF